MDASIGAAGSQPTGSAIAGRNRLGMVLLVVCGLAWFASFAMPAAIGDQPPLAGPTHTPAGFAGRYSPREESPWERSLPPVDSLPPPPAAPSGPAYEGRFESSPGAFEPAATFDPAVSPAAPIDLDPPLSTEEGDVFDEAAPRAAGPPAGSGGMPLGGMPGGGASKRSPVFAATNWLPAQAVAGQGTDLASVRLEFGLMVPVYKFEHSMLLFSLGGDNEHFTTDAVLPDSGRAFPDDLSQIRLGLNWFRPFEGGKMLGLITFVGSASDRPFHSSDEVNFGLIGFYRLPSGERNAWNFALVYMPLGELNFPIPGVSYLYNPSDAFQVNIGIPFSLHWAPAERWAVDLSYMPVRTIRAAATYNFSPAVSLSGGYAWQNEGYFLTDREDSQDRFFYYEQQLFLSLDATLAKRIGIGLRTGYAFDRFYFEGDGYDDNEQDRIDVGAGPFAGLQVEWRR